MRREGDLRQKAASVLVFAAVARLEHRQPVLDAVQHPLGQVAHIHIRHLCPFPDNLGELLRGFDRILVPEMNMGQLATLLRDKLGVETVQFNKVTGQPFLIAELVQKIRSLLTAKPRARTAPKAVRGDRA